MLKPSDLLPVRSSPDLGYRRYYYERPEDERIRTAILSGHNVLVVGAPLAGKTRAAYEALRSLPSNYDVTVAREVDFTGFRIPFNPRRPWNREIVVLDDVDKLATQAGFLSMLEAFHRRGTILVATCRGGETNERVFEKSVGNWLSLFSVRIQLEAIAAAVVDRIARKAGINRAAHFYGPIGSLFLPLKELRDQLHLCSSDQLAILRVLRILHLAGAFSAKEGMPQCEVQECCDTLEGVMLEERGWRAALKRLSELGFLTSFSPLIQCEEALLEEVIQSKADTASSVEQLVLVFAARPDVLVRMANTAFGKAGIDRGTKRLCIAAITAYQAALEVYTKAGFPMQCGTIQYSLGTAYATLAEVEDKAANCHLAISAFQAALEVRTKADFPVQYGTTQNNLGTAYATLAEVEDEAGNCRLAIAAHQAALEVRTKADFPVDYGMTQNNLGAAYCRLAEVEDKAANCHLAITAYRAALEVYTKADFPMQYGTARNNLGTAYATLAEVEDKAANCRLAIAAHQAALEVRTKADFPVRYAMTQSNLGTANATLAEVEDKATNCRLAITAYRAALEVYTKADFPMQYGTTQNNLGTAYATLAEVEDKAANCGLAITAFQAALEVRTKADFPVQYGTTQSNLGTAYGTLAEVEDKAANCRLAITALQAALEVFVTNQLLEHRDATSANLHFAIQFCTGGVADE